MTDTNPDLDARKAWAQPQLKRLDAGAAEAGGSKNSDGSGGSKRS